MKKLDIKDNVDEMIYKICEYIKACDLSDEEECQIKIESAASILFSILDITEDPKNNIDYMLRQFAEIDTHLIMLIINTIHDIVDGNIDVERFI